MNKLSILVPCFHYFTDNSNNSRMMLEPKKHLKIELSKNPLFHCMGMSITFL